jgi:hypothetical protein
MSVLITHIYQAVDANSNEKVIKFSGNITDSDLLENHIRNTDPDLFYKELGKSIVEQFNNPKNWI